MKTWADHAGIIPPARNIDRDLGEGPERCCARRRVAADELVCYDDLAPERIEALLNRRPDLKGVSPLYLCGACGETIIREKVVSREDRARDFLLPERMIEKAREHDELFRR